MTEADRILEDYSAGRLGTRATIDRLGLRDYADLVIALAKRRLALPKPSDDVALREHERHARALLMPRLMRVS